MGWWIIEVCLLWIFGDRQDRQTSTEGGWLPWQPGNIMGIWIFTGTEDFEAPSLKVDGAMAGIQQQPGTVDPLFASPVLARGSQAVLHQIKMGHISQTLLAGSQVGNTVNHRQGLVLSVSVSRSTAGIVSRTHGSVLRSSSRLFPRPSTWTRTRRWHGLKSIFIANPIPV